MEFQEINSPRNPHFRRFIKLTRSRGIRKTGLALMWGPKQVREVMEEFPGRCAGIIFADAQDPAWENAGTKIPRYRLHPDLFRQIDLFNTGEPVLLVRFDPFPFYIEDASCPPGCTLCIPFQDPSNVGTAIRSAAAFGVSRIILMKEAAHPFHPRSVRAAGSTLFRVSMLQGPSLGGFRGGNVPLITLSMEGKSLASFRFPDTFYLVPGLEGPGLPQHLQGALAISIPMAAGVESLNAATVVGIALFQWRSAVGRA